MRADRLLSILLLLQIHGRMTARDLAARLEVSERTIHRDMEALSASGVPVYAERGHGGGWILPNDFRTRPPGLTDAEVRALFLTKPAQLLADLGLRAASEAGLIKLLAALPSPFRLDAERARERIHVDAAGWRGGRESVPFLSVLQDAVWEERRVRLSYQRANDQFAEHTIEPLGLVAKRNTWYLVAASERGILTFRVSRVKDVAVLDEGFTRPPGFDLAAYWEHASSEFLANLPRYLVQVRVSPDVRERTRYTGWFATIQEEGPADEDGWATLSIRFDVEDEACRFILGFGPQVELLAPVELRRKVAELAAQTVRLYTDAPADRSSASHD
jgi:predicted DNA-binding transcriptional regulator YafY